METRCAWVRRTEFHHGAVQRSSQRGGTSHAADEETRERKRTARAAEAEDCRGFYIRVLSCNVFPTCSTPCLFSSIINPCGVWWCKGRRPAGSVKWPLVQIAAVLPSGIWSILSDVMVLWPDWASLVSSQDNMVKSNIDKKFSAHYDAVEAELKSSTVGLYQPTWHTHQNTTRVQPGIHRDWLRTWPT